MSIATEQLIAEAARLQLTWHYARLLTTKEHRQNALLTRPLGPESEDELTAIHDELAQLDRDIQTVRMDADRAGVIASQLDSVLGAIERERRLLAAMVAGDVGAPAGAGRYASHEHARWASRAARSVDATPGVPWRERATVAAGAAISICSRP